jgi:hypothetical protein
MRVFGGRPLDDDDDGVDAFSSLVVGGGRVRVRIGRDREEFGDAFDQLVRSNGFAVCFGGRGRAAR